MGLDPLDDEDALIESLNMLGQIARCQYEKSCAALIEIFDPITVHYEVNVQIERGKGWKK
jgi:exportin-7